jgi:hypothetical protein
MTARKREQGTNHPMTKSQPMPRNSKVTTADVETLNAMLVEEMSYQLRNPLVDEEGRRLPLAASTLAAISKYVASTGLRPVQDSPLGEAVRKLVTEKDIADHYGLPIINANNPNPKA